MIISILRKEVVMQENNKTIINNMNAEWFMNKTAVQVLWETPKDRMNDILHHNTYDLNDKSQQLAILWELHLLKNHS